MEDDAKVFKLGLDCNGLPRIQPSEALDMRGELGGGGAKDDDKCLACVHPHAEEPAEQVECI